MLYKFFAIILGYILTFAIVIACVFDTSNTTLRVEGNEVIGSSSFHPFQIDYLLRKHNRSTPKAEEFMVESDFIEGYIRDNITLKNKGKLCNIYEIQLQEIDAVVIFFQGVELKYRFRCDEDVVDGIVEISFFSEIGRQTNMLEVLLEGEGGVYQIYEPLDPKYQVLAFNTIARAYTFEGSFLEDQTASRYETQEREGKDVDENEYCNVLDFDALGYTHLGDMSMCDILEENESSFMLGTNTQVGHDVRPSLRSQPEQESLVESIYFQVEKRLGEYLQGGKVNVFGLWGIVFLLGFLHAAGPGHSKSILAGLMLDSRTSFKGGLSYIISYTLTHYIDIIVFSLILYIFLQSFDITSYYNLMQYISVVILFGLSIYLLYRAIRGLKHSGDCSCCQSQNRKNKSPIYLGVFSGIVPCMLAWTLFFLLSSIAMLEYLFPVVIALMSGTFVFLFLLLVMIQGFRSYGFLRYTRYLRYTPILSAVILLSVSLSIFFTIS
ncbi:hypothetical protein LAT59_01970 [Candidatus Gracilibacteria bacterium]|nr:hypothetical protein [Candidatus Gracilibacteria bacterium]